ncbi:MAG: cyclase family protein [Armatimonadota bacterium]|nr:cyclase family protein [bacterium]
MRLIDLSHSITRKQITAETIPVVVRSVDPIHLIPLDSLVTLATVVDLTDRRNAAEISRTDIAQHGVSDIQGCILRTDWCDHYHAGLRTPPPVLTIEAATYLLQGGVRTIAADFPLTTDAGDLLLHNNCILIHCLTNIADLSKTIVRMVALPVKYDDTFSAEARVIAMEE